MRLITLYLPETYIQRLDQLVTAQLFPNRSEAIRVAVRDLLVSEPKLAAAIAELKAENDKRDHAAEMLEVS